MKTVREVKQQSSLPLHESTILLTFLLKKSREFLLTHPETLVSSQLRQKFTRLEKKRSQNWPLAYLTKTQAFYGLNFRVNPSVLIPRPETEMIVEVVNKLLAQKLVTRSNKNLTLVDIGTGSGAIVIAIIKEFAKQYPEAKKRFNAWAIDISPSALKVARANAKTHQLTNQIKFKLGNLLNPLPPLVNQDLIITANLPYLTKKQIQNSPSITHEPRLALDGGSQGLKYYRALFKQIKAAQYHTFTLLCEIDPQQKTACNQLARRFFPNAKIIKYRDLKHHYRLLVISSLPSRLE